MSIVRLRTAVLLLAAGLGLSACGYDRYGYGYGGLSVGYGSGYCDPYWDDCYYGRGYDPWYGWYGDYYYPGFGIYVYDRYRRPHRWNDDHRRYWEGRRSRYGGRDWNDRRWERWDGWDRWDRSRGGDWRRDGRDRSSRRDWNETQGLRQQRVRTEPGVHTETRVRTEGTRARGERSRGEWRGRGTRSRGDWRGRRD